MGYHYHTIMVIIFTIDLFISFLLINRGLVPASAEMQYLKKCRHLDLYGVELHSVKGKGNVQYQLGVSPRGVETFQNKRRLTVFYW